MIFMIWLVRCCNQGLSEVGVWRERRLTYSTEDDRRPATSFEDCIGYPCYINQY